MLKEKQPCVVCKKVALLNNGVCTTCTKTIERTARTRQEHDYLARWLSTRVNGQGVILVDKADSEYRATRRLLARAKKLDICWVHSKLPAFKTFEQHKLEVFREYGVERTGRGKLAKAS